MPWPRGAGGPPDLTLHRVGRTTASQGARHSDAIDHAASQSECSVFPSLSSHRQAGVPAVRGAMCRVLPGGSGTSTLTGWSPPPLCSLLLTAEGPGPPRWPDSALTKELMPSDPGGHFLFHWEMPSVTSPSPSSSDEVTLQASRGHLLSPSAHGAVPRPTQAASLGSRVGTWSLRSHPGPAESASAR